MDGIGQEYKFTSLLLVPVSDQAKQRGVLLFSIKTGHFDCQILKYVPGQPTFPFDGFGRFIFALITNKPPSDGLVQHLKVVVGPVKYILGARFIGDFFHCL